MTSTRQMSIQQKEHLQSLMRDAYIPGMSIASISDKGVEASNIGYADTQSKSEVSPDTKFWACSLSKPVFAYLVLKLTKDGTLTDKFLDEELPWDEKLLGAQGEKKPLTARMILSHQTGLQNEGQPNFKFNPGEGFRYSGDGYVYLQKVIEDRTQKSLEELAQTKLFSPLGMTRTSFLFLEIDFSTAKTHDETMTPNPLPKLPANNNNAAGSLHTTATDYARFLIACINDKNFIELITPQIHSMGKDIDAKEKGLIAETLKPIDWGLGFGIQKDENERVISLFHWGHGPGARTFFDVKINLEEPQSSVAVVYLTNSENGLAIAKEIALATVGDIAPIMKFLSDKYDYKDTYSPNWKEYHEHLITGVTAEKDGDFVRAIESYKQAAKLRPEKNAELQYRVLWAEAEYTKKNSHDNIDAKDLIALAGQYGPLKISINDSKLQIDDGGPSGPRDLKQIDRNTFVDGAVILKFNRNEKLHPSSLSCHFPNGASPSFAALNSTATIAKKMDIQPKSLKTQWAADDISYRSTAEKKAAREFTSDLVDKKHASDDSAVEYRRPSKK